MKGIGGHQSARMKTDEWLTPPSIIRSLGEFDLDPCAPLNTPVIVVGISPSWFSVVTIAINRRGDSDLKILYDMVELIAPDKVCKNKFWKEKVRQKVYEYRRKNGLF